MKKTLFLAILIMIITAIPAFAIIAPFGLVQPNGGEAIPAESTYQITWDPGPDATQFNVYVSYDNGVTWALLNKSGKVPGPTYSWNVPVVPKNKTKCKVKVIGYNSSGKVGADISAAPFSIEVLNVTYPAPGAMLDAGQIRTVTWTVPDAALVFNSAKLSYTLDGGLTWKSTGTFPASPGLGSNDWTVPQVGKDRTAILRLELMNGAAKVATAVSGPFTIDVTPKTTADAAGNFYLVDILIDGVPGTNIATSMFDIQIDAAGAVTGTTVISSDPAMTPGPATLTVAPDGQAAIYDGAQTMRGVLSMDSNLLLMADFSKKNSDLANMLAIRKSSGLTNAILEGPYVCGTMGKDLSGGTVWTMRSEALFDGLGGGSLFCKEISHGACPTFGPFSYTVSADGKVTADGVTDTGAVSSDGQVFATVDTTTADNLLSYTFCIKKPSVVPPVSSTAGKFILTTLGSHASSGPWVDISLVKPNGKGSVAFTEIYTSWPPLSLPGTGTYEIDAVTGLFTVNGMYTGIASDEGTALFVLDTDASDNEVGLNIGLKTTK